MILPVFMFMLYSMYRHKQYTEQKFDEKGRTPIPKWESAYFTSSA